METFIDSPLPHDDEAERAVLGSILIDPSVVDTVINILKPDDFYNIKNKVLYEGIIELVQEGVVPEPIVLRHHLEKKGKLKLLGNENYITFVMSDAAPQNVLEKIANQLKEKSIARNLIQIAKNILIKSKEVKDVNELIEEAENQIFKLSEEKNISDYYPLGEILKQTLKIINELSKKETIVTGLPSGFYELDRLTTGFHPGDLIIVAARPAMGKTSFALSILHNVSIVENKPSAFFSLEMSKEQIAMRLLCNETKIPLRKVRSGFLTKEELEKITEKSLEMASAPIYVDDTASLSILDLRAKARKLKREKDIQLVVVDYLQLMRSSRRVENRQQEVAEISRGLKGLAKDLNIPVIALAQLSRQAELRSDKRPQLADLRESGSIEQDADMVMFIHRPEYYKKNPTPEEEGIAEIIIAKQRNGPTGTVKLAFIKEITRFENLAKDYFQSLDEEPSGKKEKKEEESTFTDLVEEDSIFDTLEEEDIPDM
ncbi:replicative DNA helicase [Hydrogenivirga sp. 128-5-R1-1]|uniref:replicative DNA helicase n=1 Tax=Hydrogenivirga sp. 128-5-R1-1 TaxID=392423 RepID=UPI00015F2764|nr:replicative DNA helicase [Hydrogenivirga sp. 128-5-R1-1]EDP74241.1 replicative DNA helicase [Hydrogenivirga sp. 128-5-R1-1]